VWSGEIYIASTMAKEKTSISRTVNWTSFTLQTQLYKYKKKKKKLNCDLSGMELYPKELCFGLYSLPKESEQISRLQHETKQSCSVPVEMRYRTGENKQMWRHFDAFLKRQMTFVLLYFRFCSSPLIENMMQKAIVTSFSFLNLSGEQKAQSSSRWGNTSA